MVDDLKVEEYRWEHSDYDPVYETLLRPDGSELASLTEPEDRNSYRDMAPITDELNRLAAALTEAERDRDGYIEELEKLEAKVSRYYDALTEAQAAIRALHSRLIEQVSRHRQRSRETCFCGMGWPCRLADETAAISLPAVKAATEVSRA